MKKMISFLSVLTLFYSTTQGQPLFRIWEHEKMGFINAQGKVVIPCTFMNGSDFAEGLAPVRLNGRYGFIDTVGTFVINPDFDFATPFMNGMACVYKDGTPYFINKRNKIVLDTCYVAAQKINSHLVIVRNRNKRSGLLDINTRKLLADTAFAEIGAFQQGVAVVKRVKNEDKGKDWDQEYALIDTGGRFIVPFGRYSEIGDMIDGYAIVTIDEKDKDSKGLIDTKGNLLFHLSNMHNSFLTDGFHNGLAAIYLYKYWIPEERGVSYTTVKSYRGYINLKGDIVFNDSVTDWVSDFSDNRAFIRKNGNYVLIDSAFRPVGAAVYQGVASGGFKKGYAIVEDTTGWGIIDVSGRFVVPPEYDHIDEAGITDSVFFFTSDGSDDDDELYGIATLSNHKILEPVLQNFDRGGFRNGLLKGMINDRLTYINIEGQVVWQEKPEANGKLRAMNIDCMNRGYFYAYSEPNKGDLGGFGGSENYPRPITGHNPFPASVLSVVVDTMKADTFYNKYTAWTVYIANNTNGNIEFDAQDSRLYMKVQAKDKKGLWRDIEYLPSSWCGNSYHVLTLDTGRYWQFSTPAYKGEFPTRLRISLAYIDPAIKQQESTEKKAIIIYSNEYSGSVNPAQFWMKNTYYPNGIMDPYNE